MIISIQVTPRTNDFVNAYDSDLVNAYDSEFVDTYTNDLVNFLYACMWKDDLL